MQLAQVGISELLAVGGEGEGGRRLEVLQYTIPHLLGAQALPYLIVVLLQRRWFQIVPLVVQRSLIRDKTRVDGEGLGGVGRGRCRGLRRRQVRRVIVYFAPLPVAGNRQKHRTGAPRAL